MLRPLLAGSPVVALVALVAACGGVEGRGGVTAASATTAALDGPSPAVSIVCDGETTRVGTASAHVQADGIHVRVENTSGRVLGWSAEVDLGNGGGGAGWGRGAPPGVSEHVLDLPPGGLQLACFDDRRDDPGEVARVAISVTDPERLWQPAVIDPPCERVIVNADFGSGADGEPGEPAAVVRRRLKERHLLRGDDELVPAGYPEVRRPARVALRREGAVVALFTLEPAPTGGWLLTTTDACTDTGLGG